MLRSARQQAGDVGRFRYDHHIWLLFQQKTHR